MILTSVLDKRFLFRQINLFIDLQTSNMLASISGCFLRKIISKLEIALMRYL